MHFCHSGGICSGSAKDSYWENPEKGSKEQRVGKSIRLMEMEEEGKFPSSIPVIAVFGLGMLSWPRALRDCMEEQATGDKKLVTFMWLEDMWY